MRSSFLSLVLVALGAITYHFLEPRQAEAANIPKASQVFTGYQVPCAAAPEWPTNVSLDGSMPQVVAVPAGVGVRIVSTVPIAYAVGPFPDGGVTADATATALGAWTPERFYLSGTQTEIALFAAVAGSAQVSVVPGGP